MKGLVLAACVGSAAAVVAPQFPNNALYQVGGGCGCVVERPYSICVATGPGMIQSTNGTIYYTTSAGFTPADFVVTDVVVGLDQTLTQTTSSLTECVKVLANGVDVCATQATYFAAGSNGYGYRSMTSGAHFQHGVVIPAGHHITVESATYRAYVTLSGYLK